MSSNITNTTPVTSTRNDNELAQGVGVFIAVFAIFSNALTLLVIWMYSYLRKKHNILLGSLAICDLLVGIAGTLTRFSRKLVLTGCVNTWVLVVVPNAKDIPVISSAFHLVVLALDRLIAIIFPLRYEEFVTTKRLFIVCIVAWIISLFITASNLFWLGRNVPCMVLQVPIEFRFALKGSIYMSVLVILGMIYGRIFLIARRAAIVHPHVDSSSQNPAPTSNKALRVVVPILLVFLVTWGAYFIYTLGMIVLPRSITTSHAWIIFKQMYIPCIYINSGANIFIYIYRSADFRRAFKSLICRKNTRDGGPSSIMTETATTHVK